VTMDYEIHKTGDGPLFPFYMGHIVFAAQVAYFWITAIWTSQHLSSPRNRRRRDDTDGDRWQIQRYIVDIFAIPRSSEWSDAKRISFSLFYSAVTTFPFLVTFLYWFVLDGSKGHAFSEGPLNGWINFSMYGVNSIICLLEILLLSGVRTQKDLMAHTIALIAITGMYFLWATFGYLVTGKYVYPQIDPDYNGRQGVFVTIATSMALTAAFFLISQGLHAARDYSTAKAACDRR